MKTKKTKTSWKKNLNRNQNNFRKKNVAQKPLSGRGIWLCGRHSVFLALQKKRREIFEILASKNIYPELEKFLEQHNLNNHKAKLKLVEAEYIAQFVGDNQLHQGLALNCSALPMKSQNALLQDLQDQIAAQKDLEPLLILDQLQDPHNVGAIIRSACAFGVKKIIMPEHNAVHETAVMNKSSSGMIENIDLYLVVNINNLMQKLKDLGYWCIGLAGEAQEKVEKIKEFKNVALVIGSEGQGIRELVKKNCDLLVKIPMNKDVESLNASVAASIALYYFSL